MRAFWNRAGGLGICLAVLAAGFAVQMACSALCAFPVSFRAGLEAAREGITDPALIQERVMELLSPMMGAIVLASHVAMLAVFFPWYYFGCGGRGNVRRARARGGRRVTPGCVPVILLVAEGMCFFCNAVLPIVNVAAPKLMESYLELMESSGIVETAAGNLAAVLVAPLGEELMFRGVTFCYAQRAVRGFKSPQAAFWAANAVQALCFGLFHGNLVQGTYAFVMGLFLGYLRKRYESLWASVAAHFLINATSLFLWERVAGLLPQTLPVYLILAAVSLAVALFGGILGGSPVRRENPLTGRAA